MTLEEWKHFRNTTVKDTYKENEKLSAKILRNKLGIECNLIKDIINGKYDWQTKEWEDIIKKNKINTNLK